MRKNLVFTPLMVAIVSGLVSGNALYAQDMSSAVMAGRVTSQQDGRPLQGVRVIIESPALLGQRQALTDANGQFRVPILPGGEYTVSYSLNGYITRKLTVRLVAGQTGNANARMSSISVQEETVEITAAAIQQIDKTDTIVASTFTLDHLDKVVGRGINNAAQLAPGLSQTDLFNEATNYLYVRGGGGNSLKTYVNGGLATQGWGAQNMGRSFVMGDLIESIAVIQSPVNARYGNTDGGMVSVVTSKGSNTFTGIIRAMNVNRNPSWRAVDYGYPNREGYMNPNPNVGGNDRLGRDYEVTVQGPLWKDRLTFSYGSRLTPRTSSPNNQGAGLWSLDTRPGGTNDYTGMPTNRVGTFYIDQDNRNNRTPTYDVIRTPELYRRNSYDGWRNSSEKNTYNQFGAYLQITPQHQVEWSYSDFNQERVNSSGDNPPSYRGGNSIHQDVDWDVNGGSDRLWSLAYKGIIGTSGVLDVHYGRTHYEWWYAPSKGLGGPPIYTLSFASRIPINPASSYPDIHALNSYDSYYVNGLIDQNVGSTQFPGGFNPQAGTATTYFNGQSKDAGNGGGTTTISLNYQHHLDTKFGSHMIDVGFNNEAFLWTMGGRDEAPPLAFDIPGQIAINLQAGQVYNPNSPNGAMRGNLSEYAGRFIVFNTRTATYNDVDPYAVGKYPGIDGSTRFFSSMNPDGTNAVQGPYFWNIMPSVRIYSGNEAGEAKTNMMSYYINDLWTINDHHSVLLGLRIDNFKVSDSIKEIHSYSQPTFRFEYKFDIHGDQSRVATLSWAQFHNNIQAGAYQPMMTPKMQNMERKFWSVGPSYPYLVTMEDILNLDNYGVSLPTSTLVAGNAVVDSDFKAPTSTELAIGFRRNLSVGGYWKASFISRSWANIWGFYPGDVFVDDVGTTNIRRVMRNSDGYERTYKALELEWSIPITRRVEFGGSYTYSRFMNNAPDNAMDLEAWWAGRGSLVIDDWWDEIVPGGREAWRPSRVTQPEHYFKFYALFDLSRGKLDSSLSLRGAYTSASFTSDGIADRYGLPYERYSQIIADGTGTGVSGSVGNQFGNNYIFNYVNIRGTNGDNWNLQARYTLSVPLVDKFAWMVNITIDNPFNHRGLAGYSVPSGTWDIRYPNGPISMANGGNQPGGTPTALTLNPGQDRWLPRGNWNDLYRFRQDERRFWLETGLRF